jgi:hypothetical protein
MSDAVIPTARIDASEVRVAARSLAALDLLYTLKDYPRGVTINLSGRVDITALPLDASDFQAVLGFLIERHETLLTGLDVEIEQ